MLSDDGRDGHGAVLKKPNLVKAIVLQLIVPYKARDHRT